MKKRILPLLLSLCMVLTLLPATAFAENNILTIECVAIGGDKDKTFTYVRPLVYTCAGRPKCFMNFTTTSGEELDKHHREWHHTGSIIRDLKRYSLQNGQTASYSGPETGNGSLQIYLRDTEGYDLSYQFNGGEIRPVTLQNEYGTPYVEIPWDENAGSNDTLTVIHTYKWATPEELNPQPAFADVPFDHWAHDTVDWAVEENITGGVGDGLFAPDRTCSVAEILTFLWRASGRSEPAGTASIPGLDTGAYYAKAALWAKEQGVIDTFSPDAPCTRAMVVTYLWKLTGSPPVFGPMFSDVPVTADYFQAVLWANVCGITNGTGGAGGLGGGNFSPDQICTRAQIVTFLYRYFTQ